MTNTNAVRPFHVNVPAFSPVSQNLARYWGTEYNREDSYAMTANCDDVKGLFELIGLLVGQKVSGEQFREFLSGAINPGAGVFRLCPCHGLVLRIRGKY
jgi:hypothetical protein